MTSRCDVGYNYYYYYYMIVTKKKNHYVKSQYYNDVNKNDDVNKNYHVYGNFHMCDNDYYHYHKYDKACHYYNIVQSIVVSIYCLLAWSEWT